MTTINKTAAAHAAVQAVKFLAEKNDLNAAQVMDAIVSNPRGSMARAFGKLLRAGHDQLVNMAQAVVTFEEEPAEDRSVDDALIMLVDGAKTRTYIQDASAYGMGFIVHADYCDLGEKSFVRNFPRCETLEEAKELALVTFANKYHLPR